LNSDIPFIEILRELNRDLKRETVKMIVLPLMSHAIREHIEKEWGTNLRVGAFGPYTNSGEETLHVISQKTAHKGSIAIMGLGFYHPDNPTAFHEITELLPGIIKIFLPLQTVEFHFYRYILPSIVDKATIHLSLIRTAAYELEGCFEMERPVLGYIIDVKVRPTNNDCPYLTTKEINDGFGQECTASDPRKCPKKAPNPSSCPFYDIVDVPWIIKKWFMANSDWSLIALNDIDSIDPYLDRFLSNHIK